MARGKETGAEVVPRNPRNSYSCRELVTGSCTELVTGPGADAGMDGTDHLWMHMRRRRRGGGGGGGGGSRTGGGVSAEFAEYGMATEREDGKKHARLLVECED